MMFSYINRVFELFLRVIESSYTKGYLLFAFICIIIPNAMDILLIRLIVLIPIGILIVVTFFAFVFSTVTPGWYFIFKKYEHEHDLNIKNGDDKSVSFAKVLIKSIAVSVIFLLFTFLAALSFFMNQ